MFHFRLLETVGREALAVVLVFESTTEILKRKEREQSYGENNYKTHSDMTPVYQEKFK